MTQDATLRMPDRVPQDPMDFWLNRLDEETRRAARSHFNRWMQYLNHQPGWENVTPRDLLVRQLEYQDKYVILDLLQNYVKTLGPLRKSSKRKAYSAIRSFFVHNRCELPHDPSFRIRGDKPPVRARLTVEDIVEVAMAAKGPYRSMILCKWQSMLDSARLAYANLNCAEQVVKQLKADTNPIRIDLPGRKANENDPEGEFFTFLGTDSRTSLLQYFENVRGWPAPGEPIWVYGNGQAVKKAGFEACWLSLLRRTSKIPISTGTPGTRYGLNSHEFRDLAISRLHTHAKNAGFDMDCCKFWCGQVGEIDKLKYDKFYTDTEYVRDQYLIAEPYLNILSNPNGAGPETLLQDRAFIESLVSNRRFIEALRKALRID